MKRRLVIIGNGMAATRLAETLVARGGDKFQIVIIGDEPWQAYNRIQLSPVLGGEKTLAQTRLLPEEWYHQHGVTVRRDESVLAVEMSTRTLRTTRGELRWDELIFATGSQAFIPPLPGVALPRCSKVTLSP